VADRQLRGWNLRRGLSLGRGFAPKDFEHDRAASGAFALDCLATVLHQLLDGIDNLFLCFALNAISFGHKSPEKKHAFNGVLMSQ